MESLLGGWKRTADKRVAVGEWVAGKVGRRKGRGKIQKVAKSKLAWCWAEHLSWSWAEDLAEGAAEGVRLILHLVQTLGSRMVAKSDSPMDCWIESLSGPWTIVQRASWR
jgi:hypothetical protein